MWHDFIGGGGQNLFPHFWYLPDSGFHVKSTAVIKQNRTCLILKLLINFFKPGTNNAEQPDNISLSTFNSAEVHVKSIFARAIISVQ